MILYNIKRGKRRNRPTGRFYTYGALAYNEKHRSQQYAANGLAAQVSGRPEHFQR